MRKKLTTKDLDNLPAAIGKRYEVRDTLVVGFLLRVSKTGAKVWCATPRVSGKQCRIKIGTYPVLSLAEARERARCILRDAQLGKLNDAVLQEEAARSIKP